MKEKKSKQVTFRVDESLYERMLHQSEQEHREISEFVRHVVTSYIEKIEEVEKMRR